MNKSYKTQKGLSVFLLILGIWIYLMVFMGIKDLVTNSFQMKDALILVFWIIFGAICFRASYALKNPYRNMEILRASNPELVAEYEREFKNAEKVCDEIWIGDKNYFLLLPQFEVLSINKVRSLRLHKYSGRYELDITTDERTRSMVLARYRENKEMAIRIAQRMAELSQVPLKNDL